MIYRRQLFKELTLNAVGVFFVLLVILLSTQIINLLGRAAGGQVALDAVGALLAVWVLGLTPLLLILTAFISILTVLTRYWRDSEMAVWLSGGLSLQRWIAPVMLFVLPFFLFTTAIALWVSPWAEARGAQFAEILKQRQELSLVKEGVFQTYQKDGSVYFVEHFNIKQGLAENLFIRQWDSKNQQTVVILARKGELLTEGDKRILHLQDGYRYSGVAGSADFSEVHFDSARLIVAIAPKISQWSANRKMASLSQLLRSHNPAFKGELMWRLSMPLSIPILAILAVALSYYNPRSGKTYNILLAVAGFFVYQNALTFLRGQIINGNLNFWLGWWPAHIIMLSVALWLLHRRNRPHAGRYPRLPIGKRKSP